MQKNNDKETLIKIILVGDAGSGKTSIITRYVDDEFHPNALVSIGIDFRIKKIELNGIKFKLQIWDTAGQERFRTIPLIFYKKVSDIMLTCDLSTYDSFANLDRWIKEIKQNCSQETAVLLVGTKNDLDVKAPVDIIKVFSNDNIIPFISTSSKTGMDINEAFTTLLKQFILLSPNDLNDLGKEKNIENHKNIKILEAQQPPKKSCC